MTKLIFNCCEPKSALIASRRGFDCEPLQLPSCSTENPVFYEDEVDIHLNPKIGADWELRGQQRRVVTPDQNEKYYLAGALHSCTGKSATLVETAKVRSYLSVR